MITETSTKTNTKMFVEYNCISYWMSIRTCIDFLIEYIRSPNF